MGKSVIVEGVKYDVVHEFSVLHNGWEMDNVGYVVRKDGALHIVTSSHGRFRFGGGRAVGEVLGKITEYMRAIEESNEALRLVYLGDEK